MPFEELKRWLEARWPSCLLVGGFLLLWGVLSQAITTKSAEVGNRYLAQSLAARVDTIFSYSRGFPKVKLSTGEMELLDLPAGGQEYLQAGDSIVKKAGTEVLTVYRHFPAYTEVSVFGGDYDSVDVEGLAKRYRIPANNRR